MAATDARSSREAIADIGDVQVRNRGTIGGAIAHADPASDLPALPSRSTTPCPALERGRAGRAARRVLRGRLPDRHRARRDPRRARPRTAAGGRGGSYQKLAQPASGYSIVGVAAVVARTAASISHARVAMTGVGEVAYRAKAVEVGARRDGRVRRRDRRGRGRHATDGETVNSDIHADRGLSIARWPWSTPVARSRPRSAAQPGTRQRPACASSGSPRSTRARPPRGRRSSPAT